MRFEDAAAHVGGPVVAAVPALREVRTGEIERVDQGKRQVLVRLRRVRAPYDFTGRKAWYAPNYLTIPAWWQRQRSGREAMAP